MEIIECDNLLVSECKRCNAYHRYCRACEYRWVLNGKYIPRDKRNLFEIIKNYNENLYI